MPQIRHKGTVFAGSPYDPLKHYVEEEIYEADKAYTEADIAKILGDIANSEESPALKSHGIGELILFEKKLYKVSAAIAIGDTLVDGTNIEETDVANEIQEAKALKEIKEATAQWTTDNYGSAKLFVISDHPTRRVLNAFADNNMRCLLFLGWNGSAYGVTVFDIATNDIVKQTPVTVTYQYVEL